MISFHAAGLITYLQAIYYAYIFLSIRDNETLRGKDYVVATDHSGIYVAPVIMEAGRALKMDQNKAKSFFTAPVLARSHHLYSFWYHWGRGHQGCTIAAITTQAG